MQFAKQYYLHYPKVGLGNWPPGFSLMQTAWGMIFGVSRLSMLLGMMVLTAWLAYLVYRAGEKYFGPVWAALGTGLLIAAPLTQRQTSMVMAEIPLAAASFLAITAFVRFLESTRTRDAVAFAVWTFCAIMIKGNGWVIVAAAPLILVATGNLALLRNKRLWFAALLTGALCVPYTLITMKIVTQGWDKQGVPESGYFLSSLEQYIGFAFHLLGIPLLAVAAVGVIGLLFRGEKGVSRRDPFWMAMMVYVAAVFAFHVAIPSSIEPRKLYQLMPAICLLVLAGLETIAAALLRGRPELPVWARPALAGLAALVFCFTGFALLPQFTPGIEAAVKNLMERPETRGAAILISSNPVWYDTEAAIIADWTSQRRNDGTYLIRGTKLLSHPRTAADAGDPSEFKLNFATPDAVLAELASIPVSFVILDTVPSEKSYPHHAILSAALEGDKTDWDPIYHTIRRLDGVGETHDVEIYRYKKSVAGEPIHFSVDLSRKLGIELGTVK
jgi:4-amino-4-deoxy-L-arabinose transferase-like glycosyltransferase